MSTDKEKKQETGVVKAKPQLPKLADLHHDIEVAFKNDELNLLLNQQPPASWVKQHPLIKKEVIGPNGAKIKVPSEYIPIDMTELLLARIFQEWKVEVLREGQLFNSVYCTIRLHYRHPVSGEWLFHDGVGAVGVQTDAGKSASDLGAIKQAAIQMALPSAKSYAIKDASDHLGKLFGKDLNRQHAIDFTMSYYEPEKVKQEENPGAVPNAPKEDELATAVDFDKVIALLNDPIFAKDPQTGVCNYIFINGATEKGPVSHKGMLAAITKAKTAGVMTKDRLEGYSAFVEIEMELLKAK